LVDVATKCPSRVQEEEEEDPRPPAKEVPNPLAEAAAE